MFGLTYRVFSGDVRVLGSEERPWFPVERRGNDHEVREKRFSGNGCGSRCSSRNVGLHLSAVRYGPGRIDRHGRRRGIHAEFDRIEQRRRDGRHVRFDRWRRDGWHDHLEQLVEFVLVRFDRRRGSGRRVELQQLVVELVLVVQLEQLVERMRRDAEVVRRGWLRREG